MSQCVTGVSPSRATGSISTHFCANVLSLGTCANRILGLQNLKNLSGFSPESVKVNWGVFLVAEKLADKPIKLVRMRVVMKVVKLLN
jgi:spore maturation protein SpmA